MRSDKRSLRSRLVPMLVAALVATGVAGVLTASPAAAAENALSFEGGDTTKTFGANAVVRIDGRLVYEEDCGEEGFADFVYPATDVYVVSGDVGEGMELDDAAGILPNTIVSTTSIFVGELIAVTPPSGDLGPGTYGVVYDTCQDGTFDAAVDTFFPGAITVVLPAVLPDASAAIADLKFESAIESVKWLATHYAMKKLFDLASKATDISCATGSPLACAYKEIDPLGQISEKFLSLLLSQFTHYLAIAEDPPDADFKRLTTLEPVSVPADHTGEAIPDAVVAALAPVAGEAALNQALLHAVERYQGAQAAGDGEWALIHARQAADFSATVAAQLPATAAAMAGLRDALAAEAATVEAAVAGAREFSNRVRASGFTPDERRTLANRGLSGAQITEAETSVRDVILPVAPSGAVEALDALIATRPATTAALGQTVAGMGTVIADLDAQASVPKAAPVADGGGPYAVAEAHPLVLDASGSTTPAGTTVAGLGWDLDGDGGFDDATGEQPTVTFPTQGSRVIGVRVTNSTGREAVAYATVAVGEDNAAPSLTSTTPADPAVTLVVGSPIAFSVAATDAEGAPLSYGWTLDGTAVGATPGFSYDPPADEVGAHTVEVTVSDGTVAGGATRHSWDVFVVTPDGDSDGWTQTTDCNDSDFAVHPGANELLGNDVDDDCDPGTPDAPPGGLTGTIWSWGANHRGALGTGAPVDGGGSGSIIPTPTQIPNYDDTVQIDAAIKNGYAVRDTGQVLTWGSGQIGQLGTGDIIGHSTIPVSPLAVGGGSGQLAGVTQLSGGGGDNHVVARRTDGTVVAWGGNQFRQIGDGSAVNVRPYPVEVLSAAGGPPLAGVRSVEAGYGNSYAIMDDGSLKSWGLQRCTGQNSVSIPSQPFPTPLALVGGGVRQVSEGNQFALILKKDGTVLSCGAGGARAGRPTPGLSSIFSPLPVTGLGAGSGAIAVSAGSNSGLALKQDGSVWAWGTNTNGEIAVLGVPPLAEVPTPRQVPLPPGPPVVAVQSDEACHSLALRADGSVLVWGCNFFGQAGPGSDPIATPTVINLPGQSAIALSTSPWNSLALTRPIADTTWERPATWVDASVADATVSEAGGGEFTVSLSAALPHDVTLDWSLAAGTADAADLPLGSGIVTVAAGATAATVPVGVTDDASDEDDETFTLILDDASHGIGLARPQATGTITDDDDPPSLSVAPARVTEGHTSLTDAQVAVALSAPSAKPVTFTYATSDATATSPGDYAATTASLRIPPGQTEATVHVAVRGDTEVEPEEALTVTLSAPDNATLATASAEVAIVDDEALVLKVASPVVTEGTGGTTPATFAVSLNPPAPPGTEVTVDYRVEGLTATVPDDVAAASGTLTFGPGDGPKEVTVAVHGDSVIEQTESFRLVLETPEASDGRPVLIGDNTAAAIVDDDTVTNAPPSCATVAPSLTSLWPPNHKMVTIAVTGATDPDGDAVTVAVTGVTQDEAVNGTGDGNTSPDAQLGLAANQVRLRAERSGTGDGRVYRLAVTATDPQGATCTTTVTVAVPHSQKVAALDSGGGFNSLGS